MSRVVPLAMAGLSFIPPPWLPSEGEIFEGRVRGSDVWHRLRWIRWSTVDIGRALVDSMKSNIVAFGVLVEIRPLAEYQQE